MKNKSLFSLNGVFNIFQHIDRWLNPYHHHKTIKLDDRSVDVHWTKRAQHALNNQAQALTVEMQLYFSCVVMKRVLFHNKPDFKTLTIQPQLNIAFHPVQATSCDPVEFAALHPAKRIMDSEGAQKMHPKELQLDYIRDNWVASFNI